MLPVRLSDREAVERLRHLPGQVIVGAWARVLRSDFASEQPTLCEVDAVRLQLDSDRSVLVAWSMHGESEGLAIEWGEPRSLDLDAYVEHQLDLWEGSNSVLPGGRVAGVRTAEQTCGERDDLLWALTLQVVGGGAVTFALGEERNGHLSYLPTAVLVLPESDSRTYRQPASRTSAWGVPLDDFAP